jgi:pimeloyl-ACP methyl ester carboxylesterase
MITASLLHHACTQFRKSNKEIYQYFAEKQIEVAIKRYQERNRSIRYLESGNSDKPLVLFIHGAPGSSDAFIDFLSDSTLATQTHMISVDRPGYGYSGFGNTEPSIEAQAAYLKPLLSLSQGKAILVGHSYGGPIAARLAMDFPELVKGIVLVAPALDPEAEKVFWVSYPAEWKVFRWMLPEVWKVTNEEKLKHKEELRLMLPLWQELEVPTTIIHGEKDKLVPLSNANFAKRKMTNAEVKLIIKAELNHLIPWEKPELIRQAILDYL